MMDDLDPEPLQVSHPHLEEFLAFLPEMNKESDRGLTLITTSFIDELLRRSIAAFLVPGAAADALLQGFNAPISSFSARIAAATALGLLHEEETKDADRLRRIRNLFAHHVHISFDDQRVKDMCSHLVMAAQDYDDVVVGPRGQFTTAAVALISNLTNRPHYVSLAKLTPVRWRI